jgi:hypothetical protein
MKDMLVQKKKKKPPLKHCCKRPCDGSLTDNSNDSYFKFY